jgi:hypothetical protein
MTFSTEDAIGDAIDRLTTQAGAVLVLALALFGTIRTAAGQDITRGIVETILEELETAEWRDDLGPEGVEALETVESELEGAIADLPLALGLSPGAAAVVWIVAYILGLAVTVVAIDSFARERDVLSGLDTEGLGRKLLHLVLGTVVFSILFFVGLFLLVLPGLLVGLFLLFFPAAIVVDDESFFSAFATSASIVRENVVSAIAIVLVVIVVGIGIGIVSAIVDGALSGVPGALTSELFGALVLAFTLALVTRAYVDATAGVATGRPADGTAPDGDSSQEPPAADEEQRRRDDDRR